MKKLMALCLGAALMLGASLRAEELKSGLEVGKSIPAHHTEKCGGAAEDGIEVGQKLCYV